MLFHSFITDFFSTKGYYLDGFRFRMVYLCQVLRKNMRSSNCNTSLLKKQIILAQIMKISEVDHFWESQITFCNKLCPFLFAATLAEIPHLRHMVNKTKEKKINSSSNVLLIPLADFLMKILIPSSNFSEKNKNMLCSNQLMFAT